MRCMCAHISVCVLIAYEDYSSQQLNSDKGRDDANEAPSWKLCPTRLSLINKQHPIHSPPWLNSARGANVLFPRSNLPRNTATHLSHLTRTNPPLNPFIFIFGKNTMEYITVTFTIAISFQRIFNVFNIGI